MEEIGHGRGAGSDLNVGNTTRLRQSLLTSHWQLPTPSRRSEADGSSKPIDRFLILIAARFIWLACHGCRMPCQLRHAYLILPLKSTQKSLKIKRFDKALQHFTMKGKGVKALLCKLVRATCRSTKVSWRGVLSATGRLIWISRP